MIMLLAAFAAYGLWRVTVVLRKGEADRSSGLILLMGAVLLAGPLVVLAWLNDERVPVPMDHGLIAGGLGAACIVLGAVLLMAGKKAG
jgi:hypothetical protein